ncbi:hypothetical protein D9M69_691950 [compost metagenome]
MLEIPTPPASCEARLGRFSEMTMKTAPMSTSCNASLSVSSVGTISLAKRN